METISLETRDGVQIVADFVESGKTGVLLVHMMPANRKSWIPFSQKLNEKEYTTLAIDLRGHGESEGGPLGYKNFSEDEHQASLADLEAGADFLKSKAIEKLILVGASIGANLSLIYLADHSEARAAVLLSPGLNYRGVKTEEPASKVKSDQAVFFVASQDDHDAVPMAERLYTVTGGKKNIKIFMDAGHGTTIFEKNPEFIDEVIHWIEQV